MATRAHTLVLPLALAASLVAPAASAAELVDSSEMVDEDAGDVSVAIKVTDSGSTIPTRRLVLSTGDLTATAGADYTAQSSLTTPEFDSDDYSAGSYTYTLAVAIIDDDVWDSRRFEEFKVYSKTQTQVGGTWTDELTGGEHKVLIEDDETIDVALFASTDDAQEGQTFSVGVEVVSSPSGSCMPPKDVDLQIETSTTSNADSDSLANTTVTIDKCTTQSDTVSVSIHSDSEADEGEQIGFKVSRPGWTDGRIELPARTVSYWDIVD